MHFDPKTGRRSAASDQNFSTSRRIFERIANEIAKNSFEKKLVAHHDGVALNNSKGQSANLRFRRVFSIDIFEQQVEEHRLERDFLGALVHPQRFYEAVQLLD